VNGLYLNIDRWRRNSLFESSISLFLAIFLSIVLVRLSLFHFLLAILIVITPYLFSRPYETLLFFLSLLILFSTFSYAMKEGTKVINIYERGSGILPFSLINCFLFFIFFAALFSSIHKKNYGQFLLIDISVLVFLTISLLYISVFLFANPNGLSMEGIRKAFHQFGVMGIVEFCLVYFIVNIVLSNKKKLARLIYFMLFLTFLKASYGIVRYAFFGGEPRNYAARMGLNFKLTFFDIYDSAFFIFIFSFCFLNIFILSRKKIFFSVAIFITLFNVLLSFRRSAWIGLIFVVFYLFQKIGRGNKVILKTVMAMVLIIILVGITNLRFRSFENSLNDVSFDFSASYKMGRFGELFYALKSIFKSPIIGHGVTGKYLASPSFIWAAPPDIVHSSVIHIALKMGFIGLSVLSLVIAGLYSLNKNLRKKNIKDEELKIMIYSTCSTLIFLVPDFLFGTPLLLFRQATVLGFFVGLLSSSAKLLNRIDQNN